MMRYGSIQLNYHCTCINTYIFFTQIEEIWPSTESEDEQSPSDTPVSTNSPLWQFLFFLLFWQSVFKVSNTAVTTLLCFLKYFVLILGKAFACPQLEEFSSTIPTMYKVLYYVQGFVQMILLYYVQGFVQMISILLNMWFALLVIVFMFLRIVLSHGREKRPKT